MPAYLTVVTFDEAVNVFVVVPPESVPPVASPLKSSPPVSVAPVLMGYVPPWLIRGEERSIVMLLYWRGMVTLSTWLPSEAHRE